jgi:hypothetical protein
MDKNAVWALFEKTGNIDAYMLYHNIGETSHSDNREAYINASEDRRSDNTGTECR